MAALTSQIDFAVDDKLAEAAMEALQTYQWSKRQAKLPDGAGLRPYVSEQNAWVVEHHGLFQGYYWFDHYDRDRDARDRYRGHPSYEACVEFCAR